MPTSDFTRHVERWRALPVAFAREVLGVEGLIPEQVDILHTVRDCRRTAVASCHESGKSYSASILFWWWVLTHAPSKCVLTAPSQRQAISVLWSEVRARYSGMVRHLGGDPGIGEPLSDRWAMKGEADWFGMAFATTTDTAGAHATKLTGFHSPFMLLVLDEASGIDRRIWDAADGLMTSASARMLAQGQPVDPVGRFADAFRSPDWRTRTISAYSMPNVREGRQVHPWGVTREWCEEMRRKFGEGSPVYAAKVLGEFPRTADDTLISIVDVERAMNRTCRQDPADRPAIGCDVARFGSDFTVCYVIRGGQVLAVEAHGGQDTQRTAGMVIRLAREYGLDARQSGRVAIDDTGVGGGVVDRLREEGYRGVRAVNFGARPPDTRDADVKFRNARTFLWWSLRTWIRDVGALASLPDESKDALRADLCAPRYEQLPDGRIALEPKADIKARVGRSPDHGDALALAVHAQGRRITSPTSRPARVSRHDDYAERDGLVPPRSAVERVVANSYADIERSPRDVLGRWS